MRSWVLALVALGSCPAEVPPTPAEPLPVWFAGCDEVAAGCAVTVDPGEPTELRLWTPSAEPLTVWLGDRRVAAEPVVVDGGARVKVSVSGLPTTLRVVAPDAAFALPLVEAEVRRPPSPDACVDGFVDSDPPEGRVEAADQAYVCARRHLATAEGPDRVAALTARDAALAELISALDEAGLATEAGKRRGSQIHLAMTRGDHDAARGLLDGFPDSRHGDIAWTRAYMGTSLARQMGELRDASQHLEEARAWVERLDAASLRGLTDALGANVSGVLGDLDGAVQAQLRVVQARPITEACDEPARGMAESAAWTELMRRAAGMPPTAGLDPDALLLQVHEAQLRCDAEPIQRANTSVNRALSAWYRGDHAEIGAILGGFDPGVSAEVAAWGEGLRASSALAGGDREAARNIAEVALDAARSGASPDAEAFAWAVMADVQLAGGDRDAAEESLREAQEALWSYLPDLPAGADRARFLGTRHTLAPRLVGLLVEGGRADEALVALRTARARALRSLREGREVQRLAPAARQRWTEAQARYVEARHALAEAFSERWALSGRQLAAADARAEALRAEAARALDDALAVLGRADADDVLRDPAAGELLVAWVPVGDRWLALLARAGQVDHRWGPPVSTPLEDLAEALVGTLDGQLDDVERITVLPWGVVHGLDIHAADLDGEPLLARASVVYSVDLPPRSARPAQGDRLLVVSDTSEDLPHARREGQRVAAAGGGDLLQGRAATLDAVLSGIASSDRLHFAGHGLLDPAQVWRSGLRLADGELEVGDILALPSAPSQVVLSGCETGRAPDDAQVAALGIAQAFVMAGADGVVAADREVGDDAAVAIAGGLLASPGRVDLESALRSAALARPRGEDWSAWRLWIP